jgi:hypothetical protein
MNQGHYNDLERPEPLSAAFLIRCWREGERWRFVVENVATRKRQGFDSLEALFDFIRDSLVGRGHLD